MILILHFKLNTAQLKNSVVELRKYLDSNDGTNTPYPILEDWGDVAFRLKICALHERIRKIKFKSNPQTLNQRIWDLPLNESADAWGSLSSTFLPPVRPFFTSFDYLFSSFHLELSA